MSSRTSKSSSSRSSTRRSSSSLPSQNMCYNWLKQPQVSIRGVPYKIGDYTPGTEWSISYTPCQDYFLEFYGTKIMKPLQLLKFVENAGLRNDRELEKIEAVLTNFENFQKYISSCIIAYGILLTEQHKSIFRKPMSMLKHELQEFYETIYRMYLDNNNPSEEELESIVEPENFLKLADPEFTDRLKKSVPKINLPDDVCIATNNTGCKNAFREIPDTAPLYPLANSIKCVCDILRTQVTLVDPSEVQSIELNYNLDDINKVSESDFLSISQDLSAQYYVEPINRPIDIELKSTETCVNKPMFYLDQIKEALFEPYLLTAQNRLKELFRSYIRQIQQIEQQTGEIINVMDPPILIKFYKLNDRKQKVYDQVIGPGPVINLFDDLAQELLNSKIFIPKESIFETERFIINPNKKYDYEYIGTLFRFLLINRIHIPFKLSRAYICKLFGLCQFNINSRNIYEQLILITIYILEKGSGFKNSIVNVFKNPELLKDKDFCENSGIFQNYPARMNDYETIVSEDREIYNDDQSVLLYNMVQFLYRNAVVEYFEDENTKQFFENFGELDTFSDYSMNIEIAQANNIAIAFPISKLDLFISGTGISMTQIQKVLIPKINKHITDNPNEQDINYHYRLLMQVLMNSTNYFSNRFKEVYDTTFQPAISLTEEQYHLEFVKYLLKFWTASSHISELHYYGIILLPGSPRTNAEFLLPKAATCSQQLKLRKRYETVESLYEDLVSSIIESSFGKEFGIA